MKKLFLLRHAKSSWKDESLSDFDRPLSGRGRKAAHALGDFMRRGKLRPALLLVSPAERARQTASLVSESGALASELRYDERIYEADAARLLRVVTQIDEQFDTALLVGHNPGMEELIELLTGESRRMPTAALAGIALDADKWGKARDGCGRLEWIVKPADLEEGGGPNV